MQNAFLRFEKDSVATGEIWAIASGNDKTIFSNNIGQLTLANLVDKNPSDLPALSTQATIDLSAKSLVRSLAFDPAESCLACGMIDGNVIITDKLSSNPVGQNIVYNHNSNRVLNLGFVPGKNWLISTSTDRIIRVWDIAAQKIVKDLIVSEPVQKFVVTDPGHLIFLNSAGQILLWHLNDLNSEPQIIYTSDHQPFRTLAYDPEHKWLAVSSSGTVLIFLILNPDNPGTLKPEQFTLKHKTVITHMEFSPDHNWLVTGSADALMLWDLRDIGTKEVDKFEPIVIDNNRQLYSVAFNENSRFLFYGDNKILHILPVDIKDIYNRLSLKTGNKKLNDQQWKYYVKGNLVKPE
jgi:WD40 repeat protein